MACGSAPDDVAATEASATTSVAATEETAHVVPASPAVAHACATEIATTYCAREDAERAARACAARLGPEETATCDGRACARVWIADRRTAPATCRAGLTYPTRASCTRPVAEDCSFYRACLEASRPCGDDGYALGFGERLCFAFVEDARRFSDEGQAWLRDVRPCLQQALVPSLDDHPACDEAHARAMSSHVACYTDERHSICDLPIGDVVELARVLGGDLFTWRALRQVKDIGLGCASRALARALGLPTASSERAELEGRRAFFTELDATATDEATLRAFLARRRAAHLP